MLDCATCAGAIVAGGRHPDAFFWEGRFLTWLDVMQLSSISALSLALYTVRRSVGGCGGARLWLLAWLGSLYLALDEGLLIHERVGALLATRFGFRGVARHLYSDALIVLYGLSALTICLWYRRELLHFRGALQFIGLGLVLIALSEWIDVFMPFGRRDVELSVILEESAKLVGFGAALGGFIRLHGAAVAELAARPRDLG
jgi:hypothetical protein